jgi:HEAT repeat protein
MKHMTAREKELAAPCLVASLRDTGEYIRKRAARALGAMGQPCLGKAVDELIRLVREDAASRREAIEALRAVRPLPRQAMTALIEALGDQTDACDLEISEVLLGQPRLTTKAVQALGRILHHGSRIRARKTAANALAGAGDPSLDQLLGALGDPQCGWIAAIGLASAGRRSAKKVAGLLSDSTALVRRNAIRCLDLIGSPSESIRTELARLTEDIDVGVRLAAKKALRHSPARRGSPSAGRTTVRNESVATRVLPG